jgi:hypothetical protein
MGFDPQFASDVEARTLVLLRSKTAAERMLE